jgi:transcriptional regulator GlxA family with amidase domain
MEDLERLEAIAAERRETILFSRPLASLAREVAHSRRLTCVLHLIESRHGSKLSLENAAVHCGIEKNHLNSLLRRTTGFTFHQLLTRYRLLRAERLLRSSDLNILEIALESGFGSVSSLERNFQSVFSEAPSRFRKRQRRAFEDDNIKSC